MGYVKPCTRIHSYPMKHAVTIKNCLLTTTDACQPREHRYIIGHFNSLSAQRFESLIPPVCGSFLAINIVFTSVPWPNTLFEDLRLASGVRTCAPVDRVQYLYRPLQASNIRIFPHTSHHYGQHISQHPRTIAMCRSFPPSSTSWSAKRRTASD